MNTPYDLEISKVLNWIKTEKANKVLIQAPDGIKPYLTSLITRLKAEGIEIFISGSHTWGGCDIAIDEARALNINHIIHIGHHGPVRALIRDYKVLFIPGRSKVDIKPVVRKAARILRERGALKVALMSTIQHIHRLNEAAEILREEGLSAVIGKSPDPLMQEGLLIGCDMRGLNVNKRYDSVIVISGGIFHGLGAALWTSKKVIAADPYLNKVTDMEKYVIKIISRRLKDISDALESRKILIVTSTKPGQSLVSQVSKIKKALTKIHKEVYVAIFNEITREKLENMGKYDTYINAACPRLAIDNRELFPGPVVNIGETPYLLGKELEKYDPRDIFKLNIFL